MQLTSEQKRILDGAEGPLLQECMASLIKCGEALGAADFVPVTSVHTSILNLPYLANCFGPRGRELTEADVRVLRERLSKQRVPVRTTTNPGMMDLEQWRLTGSDDTARQTVQEALDTARQCGILTTFSCIPYLTDNIPALGEHCAWAETSAVMYANSFLGARTNRESYETSIYSALLGITPNYGMHLTENRRGTDLVDVRVPVRTTREWGMMGYYAGGVLGLGIPVFRNLTRPSMEDAKQFCSAINVSAGMSMVHIAGVTPEAPTEEAAFGGNAPRRVCVYDEAARRSVEEQLNRDPHGKVDMVYFGCPHATLYELKELARLLEGRHAAPDTKLWVMTTGSIKAAADRLGYGDVIRAAGGELISDGCLNIFYNYGTATRPKIDRIATNSVKQSFSVQRAFGSKTVFAEPEICVEIAVEGGY